MNNMPFYTPRPIHAIQCTKDNLREIKAIFGLEYRYRRTSKFAIELVFSQPQCNDRLVIPEGDYIINNYDNTFRVLNRAEFENAYVLYQPPSIPENSLFGSGFMASPNQSQPVDPSMTEDIDRIMSDM